MITRPPRLILILGILCLLSTVTRAADPAAEVPAWVEPMKEVRARFKGTPGTFAHFGDSITVSMAFWAPLAGEPKGMSSDMKAALEVVKGRANASNSRVILATLASRSPHPIRRGDAWL